MLTEAQCQTYDRDGFIVVPDVFSPAEIDELRRVTDEFVAGAARVTANDDIYDLEDSHTPQEPHVRRLKAPHLIHPAYFRASRNARVVEILADLWGTVRFDTGKLNMKSAGYGAPVEWHQDWAFYPHTNDDLAAVGVMMDDMELENGPLMIIPGTHKGPVFDHHYEGKFCGAMDPARKEVDYAAAVPLTGRAGSITIHHVRAVHGSAPNLSAKPRRLLLFQFRAADAWPLLGYPAGLEAYQAMMAAGSSDGITPRLEQVPVRLPLPPADLAGSIYENQKGLKNRFFETVPAKELAGAK